MFLLIILRISHSNCGINSFTVSGTNVMRLRSSFVIMGNAGCNLLDLKELPF